MSVINWLNDPLLYDQECTPMNEWLTANKLIEAGQGERIFAEKDTLTLNLYPILIRRVDFIRESDSDRVLSRFPFLVLTNEEKVLIKSKILLIAEFVRDYFYRSITSGIMDWKRRLQTYLKRGAMPYPLYRCACEILDLPLHHSNVDELFFESARGKQYSIPTKLTNAIAYLCGVINGDGHLNRHWLRITDETKKHISFLSKLLEQLFHDDGEIFLTGNAWNVELRSSAACRLFNFLTDQTIEGAKYDSLREPLLFKTLGESFRKFYWGGMMDADGSFRGQITFSTASEQFAKDFQDYLQTINIESGTSRINGVATSVYVLAKHKVDFAHHIGVLNPKKALDYQIYLQRKKSFFKFIKINEITITKEGYFDLSLMKTLLIKGLGTYLKEFRGERTYTEIRNLFDLSVGSYSRYENEQTALPFALLQEIIVSECQDKNQIYSKLNELRDKIRFQVAGSIPIQLPLNPIGDLNKILPFLEPKLSYVNLLTEEKDILENISQLFEIPIEGALINSKLIVHFLKTFCIYEEFKDYIKPAQFNLIQKQWREELFNF